MLSPSSRHVGGHAAVNPVASFLRGPSFAFCLAVFDSRRGQHEGEEYEKVLSFFPTSVALTTRTTVVGLAQAVTSFADTFAQGEGDDAFKVMECEANRWVMYECEPCIWMLMVVSKSWAGASCSEASLRGLLVSLHQIFVLLHGPMARTLEQDPTAHSLRRALQPFVDEVGMRYTTHGADPRDGAALPNPLGTHRGLPLLSTSHRAFLGVQSLVNHIATTPFTGSRPVAGAVVLWHGRLLWSTVGRSDTAALYHLAGRALAPLARAATRQKALKVPSHAALCDTLLSPHQWQATAATGSHSGTPRHSDRGPGAPPPSGLPLSTPPSVPSAHMHTHSPSYVRSPGGALTPVPPAAANAAVAGKGGAGGLFLCPRLRLAARDSSHELLHGAVPMARVWMQDAEEWCGLLPYCRGPLLVLVLLAEGSWAQLSGDVLCALGEALSAGSAPLAAQLSAELPSYNLWHEPGHRYSHVAHGCGAARATPPRKVATLSPHSQRVAAELQDRVDAWLAAAAAPGAVPGAGLRGDVEVAVRTCLDTWGVVRVAPAAPGPGAMLCCVLEQPSEPGLLAVNAKVNALCSSVCPGDFPATG